jgi:hypothetical protein
MKTSSSPLGRHQVIKILLIYYSVEGKEKNTERRKERKKRKKKKEGREGNFFI